MFEDSSWDDLLLSDIDKLTSDLEPSKVKTEKLKEGERRVVCVLFADISGFTALSEKLDPEQVYMILDKVLKVFTNVINNYSGYVDKYEGDAIMALFGAKSASENDTERAIRASLEMVEKLKQINLLLRKNPNLTDIDLKIRVGINTGLVTTGKVGVEREGDFTVYGDAVNLASRMESKAPLSRIMIPEETMNLAKEEIDFEHFGEVKVKGKEKPINTFLVKGVNQTLGKRWERILDSKRSKFIGRDFELDELCNKYDLVKTQLDENNNSPIKIVGLKAPGGFGKTRLIYEFFKKQYEEVDKKNLTLYGHPHPYLKIPYGILISVLQKYFGIFEYEPKDVSEKKFSEGFENLQKFSKDSDLERLKKSEQFVRYLLSLSFDKSKFADLTPQAKQTQINVSLRFILEAIVNRANSFGFPLVLTLDDIHWLDENSHKFLEYFFSTFNIENEGKTEHSKKILVFLLYRPDYEISEKTVSKIKIDEYALKPLTLEQCSELIKSRLTNIHLSIKIYDELFQKSGGNPFYLEEWIKSLLAQFSVKELSEIKEIDEEQISIPMNINSILLTRMDTLEKGHKSLIQVASVIGTTFTSKILSKVSDSFENIEFSDSTLDSLVDSGWLTKTEENDFKSFSFNQFSVQNVAYNTLLIHNRKLLHKITAEILIEENELNPFVIYSHYKHTDLVKEKIEFGFSACKELEKNCETQEAIKIYNNILELEFETSEQKLETLYGRACLETQITEWDKSEKDLSECLELTASISSELVNNYKGKIFCELGKISNFRGDFDQAIDFLGRSDKNFETNSTDENLINLNLIYTDVLRKKGRFEEAQSKLESALKSSMQLKDFILLSRCTYAKGHIHWFKGEYLKAKEMYLKNLEICEKIGDKRGISLAVGMLGAASMQLKENIAALEFYFRKRELAEEIGDKIGVCGVLINISILEFQIGEFQEAIENLTKAQNLNFEIGDKTAEALILGNFGNIFKATNNLEKAEEFFNLAISKFEKINFKYYICEFKFELEELNFQRKKFENLQKRLEELEKFAEEVKHTEAVLKSQILTKQIQFEESVTKDKKLEAVSELEKLLNPNLKEIEKAKVNYEIAKLYSELEKFEEANKFQKVALELYISIFTQCETYDVSLKINELENLKLK
ncbi:MAG: hypothetical protein DWQ06_11300 [Calditrichaeota bacterium]|nr:MAG: hypothetical protein DWQ06_11300 [Calditrichota bacterium]